MSWMQTVLLAFLGTPLLGCRRAEGGIEGLSCSGLWKRKHILESSDFLSENVAEPFCRRWSEASREERQSDGGWARSWDFPSLRQEQEEESG